MAKIVKLHVERGRSVQVNKKLWDRSGYGLEANVSDLSMDELEKLRLDLRFKIDDWLEQEKHVPQPEDVIRSDIPEIDLAELDECPWLTYQKNPAGPGKAAWIKNPAHFERFDAPKVLWELVKALEGAKDRKLVLGDMQYNFGGDKGQFINRKPAKTERAR